MDDDHREMPAVEEGATHVLCAAVEETAAHSPAQVAVAGPDGQLTYGELAASLTRASALPPERRTARRVGATVAEVERILVEAVRGSSVLLLDAGATTWELERAGEVFRKAAADPEMPAGAVVGLCTSGSSGLPKVVELDWEGLIANAGSFAAAAEYGPDDVLWCTTPLAHLYCLGAGVVGGLLSGSTVMLSKGMLDPGDFERIADEWLPTVLLSVPFLFRRYLQMLRYAPEILSSLQLRSSIAAGEPVPAELVAAWREVTGVELLAHYGLTEGGQITLATGGGKGVGKPLSDVEARVDAEGQVQVRRRAPARPYRVIGQEADPAGWYSTGDLGRLDEHGDLHIEGRADSRINVAGKKVDPVEVEEALASCAGISDCAVASVEGSDGTQVVAFVCAEESVVASDGEIRVQLAQRLSPHKLPRLFARVAEIPRTLTGKVRRGELIAGLATATDDVVVPSPAQEAAGASPLARRLAGLTEAKREAAVLELVREQAATVALGHPSAASIDPARSFKSAGFDSLLAVELINALSRVTGLRLHATLVFDYPSPLALAGFLLSQVDQAGGSAAEIGLELDRVERLISALHGTERQRAVARLESLLRNLSGAAADGEREEVDLEVVSDDELIELIDAEFGSA